MQLDRCTMSWLDRCISLDPFAMTRHDILDL
jgi:hypothetical protein